MRIGVILCAMLALAGSTAGQVAAGIHLADVRFSGTTRLEGVDLKKCSAGRKSRIYEGTEWMDGLVDTVTECLQDKGYFKAAVKASSRQLPDSHGTHQFAITFDIDAGARYRLAEITFKNNRVLSNTKALRNLFPIKDGDIFDRNLIAKGLENLRYAYGEYGFINFTPVPDTTFDEDQKLISLEIDVDEGKQFYVSSINVVGADPQVLSDLHLTRGQIYNVRLVDLFLRRHLPGADVNDPRIRHLSLDEQNGTVALTFDFSRPRK